MIFPKNTGMITKVEKRQTTPKTTSTIEYIPKEEEKIEVLVSSVTTSIPSKFSIKSTTTSLKIQDPCVKLGCSEGTKYVGSKKSNRYHLCTCKWARRISKKNLICFRNEDEAIRKGYVPCKVCIGKLKTTRLTSSSTIPTTIEVTNLTTSTTISYSNQVYINEVQYNAPGNDWNNLNGEWVEICGSSNMTGWSISDEANHTFYFPSNFILTGCVRIYTGSGNNTNNELYWNSKMPIWNNDHDTVFLKNEEGGIADTFKW